MKTIKHILYILIFVLGFTNCMPHNISFVDNNLENDIMVIIDKNGGNLNIDEYYIFEGDRYYFISLPKDDDLMGYELKIDGTIYPPGIYLRSSSNDEWYLYYGEEGKYFNYPSDRTIIFKAIWKND